MEIVIKPKAKWWKIDWQEIWQSRELVYIFAWRDFKVRYKQTLLGVVWVLFQPVVMTAVFSIFFGKLAKIPTGGMPYPLFSYSGLLIWNLFSTILSNSSHSIVGAAGIISKVYFPRILIPISTIVTALVDFFIALVPLIAMLVYFKTVPSLLLFLYGPILVLVVILAALSCGLVFAAINVRFRDVRFILPFFLQAGLFATPVIYPLSIIFDYRRWLLVINPLTGVIENFRILLLGGSSLEWGILGVSFSITVLLSFLGLFYFRSTERIFADIA